MTGPVGRTGTDTGAGLTGTTAASTFGAVSIGAGALAEACAEADATNTGVTTTDDEGAVSTDVNADAGACYNVACG